LAAQLLRIAEALLARGRAVEARDLLEAAVLLDPESPALRFAFANSAYLAGDLESAAAAYEELVARWPSHAEGHYNLGVTWMRKGSWEAARNCFARALELRPSYAEARNNLAVIAALPGRSGPHPERELRAAAPQSLEALYNLALLWQKAGDAKAARRLYCKLLDVDPGHADAANNLGNLELEAGRVQEALELYERTLAVWPEHAEARWNRCLALLALGRYTEAWPEYDWRFRQPESVLRRFDCPRWQPQASACAPVWIHAEQGFGDTLQFTRYLASLPLLGRRAGGDGASVFPDSAPRAVTFEVQPPLARLILESCGAWGPEIEVIAQGLSTPRSGVHLPLMSLPGVLESSVIPDRVPYLSADPRRIEAWRKRLPVRERFRVGMVWSGNPKHRNDRRRSLPARLVPKLIAVPEARFYSLQPGVSPAREMKALLGPGDDFAETAALISLLDLVITVDTSVAHLAGALGRPVWTLLPYAADWRWQQHRPDTPWYPTMRLFRQTREGDWHDVVRRVSAELSSLAARACSSWNG
jgi:tetratricopeptide (TPR) repeat protein